MRTQQRESSIGSTVPDRPGKLSETSAAGASTIAEIPALDLDLQFPNPAKQYMPGDNYSNRWAVNHIITEIARHAGHADLIREAIDGATAYELNFYAEGGTPEQWAEQATAWGIE